MRNQSLPSQARPTPARSKQYRLRAGLTAFIAALFVSSGVAAQSLSGYLLNGDALQRITLGTAVGEVVSDLPMDRYRGLAFDAQGGLWTIDQEQPALVQLSTEDGGVVATVPLTGLSELTSPDLVFDACGRLWVSSTRTDDAFLYSIDAQNGNVSLVGNTGVEVTSLTSIGTRLIALTYVDDRRESQLVDLDSETASPFAPRNIDTSVSRAWIDFSAQGSLWGVSPMRLVGPQVPGSVWTADSAGGGRNIVAESFDLTDIRGFALAPTQGTCGSANCVAGPNRACVLGDRFEVSVDWQTTASSGSGQVADAGSEDSAIFTFFDPDNWEVLVKVLDGCSVNGFTWVYFAGTTDVQFRLTVVDTVTGLERSYDSVGGMPAETVTDSGAFPCSSP